MCGCTQSVCMVHGRLKGKGLKLLHHYPDQLWTMGDKSVPNAGFTPARIFPQVTCLEACTAVLQCICFKMTVWSLLTVTLTLSKTRLMLNMLSSWSMGTRNVEELMFSKQKWRHLRNMHTCHFCSIRTVVRRTWSYVLQVHMERLMLEMCVG